MSNRAVNILGEWEMQGLSPNNMRQQANLLEQPVKNAVMKQLRLIGYANNANNIPIPTNIGPINNQRNNGGLTVRNNVANVPQLVSAYNNTEPENVVPAPAAKKNSWFSRLFTRRRNNQPVNSANVFVTNQMANLKSPQQIAKMVNAGPYNNSFKKRVRNTLRKKGYSV